MPGVLLETMEKEKKKFDSEVFNILMQYLILDGIKDNMA